MKVAAVLFVLSAALGCGGVGSSNQCFVTAIKVFPQTATVDHTATPPANSQVFNAFQTGAPSGCAFTQANLQTAVWSVSDTVNASISNSHDQSNINFGRATCIKAASSITVTATVPSGNGSNVTANATLTCN